MRAKIGFTASTSKVTSNRTPMVVTVICGLVKFKLQVAFWNPPYNLPQLPFNALNQLPLLVCFFFAIIYATCLGE